MIVAYGWANLLQSMAVLRAQPHHTMHPSLLLRLASQRIYMAGIGFQILGFLLAFLARRELPLFLVQASITAGLGVMAILGVAILKWRLPRSEVLLLCLLGFGVTGLVISAKPGVSRPIDFLGAVVLTAAFGLIALSGVFAVRLHGMTGSVVLGSLAGLAFGAAAIDSRALAASHSWHALALNPLLYLLFAHSLLGQLLLAMAMQRGSTTVAVAAMDAASTAPAAIVGLTMLGDQIWPGRQWLAAAGFTCTLIAVIGLARFAQPQAHRAATVAGDVVTTTVVGAAASTATAGAVAVPDASEPPGGPIHQAARKSRSPVPLAGNRAAAR
jgi:drug/metabolite transporter (DMT)-like permease